MKKIVPLVLMVLGGAGVAVMLRTQPKGFKKVQKRGAELRKEATKLGKEKKREFNKLKKNAAKQAKRARRS